MHIYEANENVMKTKQDSQKKYRRKIKKKKKLREAYKKTKESYMKKTAKNIIIIMIITVLRLRVR